VCKYVETGQQKARKVSNTKKKPLDKHVATNRANWQEVNNITGNKKSTLERQSLLEANWAEFQQSAIKLHLQM